MSDLNIKPNTDLNIVFNETAEKKIIVIERNNYDFKTPIRKAISSNEILTRILNLILPINFNHYINLESGNFADGKNAKRDLDDEEKIVVILENLLMKVDEINLGIIMDNYSVFAHNTGYWEEIDLKLFKSFLSEVAIRSGFSKLKARKKRFNELLFNQFTLTASSYIEKSNIDIVKINLLNGTFHIDSRGNENGGVLKPFNKDDYFKYQLSFEYNPKAEATEFIKFMNEVLPDIGCQNVLLEFIAYSLTKHLKLEKVLILFGTGSNGKSAFFEIISALLGNSNVSTIDMRRLCDENGYYRVGLDTKLLNYASEFGGKIDNQMFKKLISGEPIEARLPNKEPIVIKDYCKFMFNANKLPDVEHTEAFFRRPIIIPFTKKIQKSQIDIHLPKRIIKNELSGIFNLVLDALDRLLKQNGFSESELIEKELEKYKKESDTVLMFLEEENWIASTTQKMRLNEFYPFYEKYCKDINQIPLARPKFGRRLKELGFVIQKSTNNYHATWVERDLSQEEKNPFETFIKPDENIVEEILNKSKNL